MHIVTINAALGARDQTALSEIRKRLSGFGISLAVFLSSGHTATSELTRNPKAASLRKQKWF